MKQFEMEYKIGEITFVVDFNYHPYDPRDNAPEEVIVFGIAVKRKQGGLWHFDLIHQMMLLEQIQDDVEEECLKYAKSWRGNDA